MTPIMVKAHYRASIPLSVGRVKSVDSTLFFEAFPSEELPDIEVANTLRIVARQKIANWHGISPLLVVIMGIETCVEE